MISYNHWTWVGFHPNGLVIQPLQFTIFTRVYVILCMAIPFHMSIHKFWPPSTCSSKQPIKQSPKAFFDMLARTQEVVAKATTCPPGIGKLGEFTYPDFRTHMIICIFYEVPGIDFTRKKLAFAPVHKWSLRNMVAVAAFSLLDQGYHQHPQGACEPQRFHFSETQVKGTVIKRNLANWGGWDRKRRCSFRTLSLNSYQTSNMFTLYYRYNIHQTIYAHISSHISIFIHIQSYTNKYKWTSYISHRYSILHYNI